MKYDYKIGDKIRINLKLRDSIIELPRIITLYSRDRKHFRALRANEILTIVDIVTDKYYVVPLYIMRTADGYETRQFDTYLCRVSNIELLSMI